MSKFRKIIIGVLVLSVGAVAGYQARYLVEYNLFRTVLNVIGVPGTGPSGKEDPFEEDQLRRLARAAEPLEVKLHDDFQSRLRDAVGYESYLQTERTIRKSDRFEFSPVPVEEIVHTYENPGLDLHALMIRSETQPANGLAVVLYGVGSTPAKVLGLDSLDYTSAIGKQLNNAGYDVVVPEMPSTARLISALNMRLLMLDYQYNGLFAHFACNLINHLSEGEKYERVVVYGVRFGARLAEELAHLCDEQVSRVVADSIAIPWRDHIRMAALKGRMVHPNLYTYRNDLMANSSYLDFFKHPAPQRLYLLGSQSIDDIAETQSLRSINAAEIGTHGTVLIQREIDFGFTNPVEALPAITGDPFTTDPTVYIIE